MSFRQLTFVRTESFMSFEPGHHAMIPASGAFRSSNDSIHGSCCRRKSGIRRRQRRRSAAGRVQHWIRSLNLSVLLPSISVLSIPFGCSLGTKSAPWKAWNTIQQFAPPKKSPSTTQFASWTDSPVENSGTYVATLMAVSWCFSGFLYDLRFFLYTHLFL